MVLRVYTRICQIQCGSIELGNTEEVNCAHVAVHGMTIDGSSSDNNNVLKRDLNFYSQRELRGSSILGLLKLLPHCIVISGEGKTNSRIMFCLEE